MRPTLRLGSLCPCAWKSTTCLATFILLFLGFSQNQGFSQTLYNYVDAATGVRNADPAHVTGTNLSRGAGLGATVACPGANDGFGADSWPTYGFSAANLALSNTNGDYFQFSLTPDAGYGLKITGFTARLRREQEPGTASDGPTAIQYGYSTDGGMSWTVVDPGNPSASSVCTNTGALRPWPSFTPVTVSGPVLFRIYGFFGGSAGTGDLALRNVQVLGIVCATPPSITLGASPVVCYGAGSASLGFTATSGDLVSYSVDFDAAANMAGLSDVATTTFPTASPFSAFTFPGTTAPGTYNGVLTVTNGCGFTTTRSFTVTIHPRPRLSATVNGVTVTNNNDGSDDTGAFAVCNGVSPNLSFSPFSDASLQVYPPGQVRVQQDLNGTNVLFEGGSPDAYDNNSVTLSAYTAFTRTVSLVNPAMSGTLTMRFRAYGDVNDNGVLDADECAADWLVYTVTVNQAPAPAVMPSATTVCAGGTVTVTFNESNYPQGAEFTVTTTVDGNPVTYTDIVNGSTVTLSAPATVGALTFTHETTGCSTTISGFSVVVNNVNGGSISADQTICSGDDPGALNASGQSGSGMLTYQWQSSTTDCNGVFTDIGSATSNSYDPPASAVTTYYRLVTTSTFNGVSCTATSNCVAITVNDVDGGSISAEQTVCTGDVPAPLSATGQTGSGTLTYQWQSSATDCEGGFSDIGGETGLTYAPPAASVDMHYRLVTTSTLNGVSCTDTSNCVTITVNDVEASDISGDQTVCYGGDPEQIGEDNEVQIPLKHAAKGAALTDGITYQWQSSTSDCETGFTDIPMQTTTVYDPPALTQTTYYHLITISTLNGVSCTDTSNCVTITVRQKPVFTFTAQVGTRPAVTTTNGVPSTVSLDFCAGEFFTFSNYSSTPGNVGYTENLISTGNVLYNGGPVPAVRPPTNISAGSAAGYFAGTYGPYALSGGSSGSITQTYTPYIDVNENGVYDDGIDCPGDPITLVYNVYANPTATANPSSASICSGETTNIALSADVANTTFAWTAALTSGMVSGYTNNSGLSIADQLTGSGTVTYTITPTGPAPNFCTGADITVSVTVNPLPAPSISGGNAVCMGSSLTLTGTPGIISPATLASEGWSTSNPGVATVNTSGVVTPVSPGTTVITYSATDNNGCSSSTAVTVTVNPLPTPSITGPSSVCAGSSITLTGNPGVVMPQTVASAVWSTSNLARATVDQNGVVTGVSAGTVTIGYTVTDNNGCSSATSVTITVNSLNILAYLPGVNAPGTLAVCQGNNAAFLVTFTGSTTVTRVWEVSTDMGMSWTTLTTVPGSVTFTNTTVSTRVNLLNVSNTMNGYKYRVTLTAGACSITTNAFTLEVQGPISITQNPVDVNICDATNSATFTGAASNAGPAGTIVYVWQYSLNGNVWIPFLSNNGTGFSGAFSNNLTVNSAWPLWPLNPPNPPYTIMFRLTAATSGLCVANSTPATLGVYPVTNVSAGADAMICQGGSYVLNGSVTGFVTTGTWTASAGGMFAPDNTTFNATYTPPANFYGTDTLVLTSGDPAGPCPAVRDTMYLMVKQGPAPTITGSSTVHVESAIQLNGQANPAPNTTYTDMWTSSNDMLATVGSDGWLTAGSATGTVTITYTVTDDNGCSASATFVVTIIPKLELITAINPSTITCGDTMTVTVAVKNFQDVSSLQFSVGWDPTKFMFVGDSAPDISGSSPFIGDIPALTDLGELSYSWYDLAFLMPGQYLPDSSIILTITLKAISGTGPTDISITADPAPVEASNSSLEQLQVVIPGDLDVPLVPVSVDLDDIAPLCAGASTALLPFSNPVGNPDQYTIHFDSPLFDPQNPITATLVAPNIIINVPSGLPSGTYTGTVVVRNSLTGCESEVYPIELVMDITPPTASNPAPITGISCVGNIPAPDVSVVTDEADNCPLPNNPVTWVSDVNNGGFGCMSSPYVVTRTYRVTDASGLTVDVTQTITVIDTVPPTVTQGTLASCYPTQLNAELAALNATVATDNCGTVTKTVSSTGDPCALTITVLVSDPCGNLVSKVYTTKIDNTPPTATAGLLDDCYENEAEAKAAAIAATLDNSTDNCTGPLTATAVVGGTPCSSTVTVVVQDACGNASQPVTYNTRIDGQGPMIVTGQIEACYTSIAEAEADVNAVTTATDLCSGAVDMISIVTEPGCPAIITYTATDACGNTSTATYTTKIDNEAPMASANDDLLPSTCFKTIEEAEAAAIAATTATDNCTGSLHMSATSAPVMDCFYDITVTVTDGCGNSNSDAVYGLIKIDNTPPTADALPNLGTYTCFSQVPAPNVEDVTGEEDNCGGSVTVSWVSDSPFQGCSGTITRTYAVVDECNNSTLITQTITINDNVAPTWSTTAGALNATLQCSDQAGLATAQLMAPVATDNCGGTVTLVKTSGTFVPGTCPQAGTYTNSWIATDGCGNASASFTQVITIIDDTPPQWTTAVGSLNVTVICDNANALAAAQAMAPVATDNCDGSLSPVKNAGTFVSGGCPQAGTYTNTWTVTDDCGNTSTVFTQVITVVDNTAPTWVTIPTTLDRNVSCSDAPALAAAQALFPTATDNCDGSLTPVKSSGSFVPGACPQAGTYTNTWTVTDDCGNSSTVFTQIISVYDNIAPTWATAPGALNATVSCSDLSGLSIAQAMTPTATDNCDGSLPAPVKTSGTFVPGTACPQSGTITNTWVVTDHCGNTSTSFTQVITIIDNTPPVAAAGTIAPCYPTAAAAEMAAILATSAEDACGGAITKTAATSGDPCAAIITVTVKDACQNATTMTYTTRIDNTPPTITLGTISSCYTSVALAESAAIAATTAVDNCTGALSYVASTSGTCQAVVTITVIDGCGNSATVTYNTRIDNTAPIITAGAGNQTVQCDGNGNTAALNAWLTTHGGATATDNCGSVTWTYLPAQPVLSDLCGATGSVAVTFIASDNCGNTAITSATFTVVDNTAPVITAAATNMTVQCDGSGNTAALNAWLANHGGASATDACSGVTWTHNFTELSDGCGATGSATVLFTATDGCGNSAQTSATFSINDTQAPTFTDPADITINVDASCNYNASPAITGDVTNESDNCSTGLNATYTDATVAGTGQVKFVITRTWTLTDACGNSATALSQVITVKDVTPPTLVCAANVTVSPNAPNCSATGVNLTPPIATDNCVTIVSVTSNAPATYSGATVVTWTATDGSTNTGTCTQTVTVVDNLPPTLLCRENAIRSTDPGECNRTAVGNEFDLVSVSDQCGILNLMYTLSGATTAGPVTASTLVGVDFQKGVTTVVWKATDTNGNTATCSFTVTVNDNQLPSLICPPTITVSSSANSCDANIPNLGTFTATDNCAIFATSNNAPTNHIFPVGATIVTYTATDMSGNSASCTQLVGVKDLIPPTITCPANLTLTPAEGTCTAAYGASASATATDNCGGVTLSWTANNGANPASGSGNIPSNTAFNQGVTTITYVATDGAPNTASCSYTVSVTCIVISGQIIWEHLHGTASQLPVAGATVTLSGSSSGSTTTNASGNYTLFANNGTMLMITPTKPHMTTAQLLNGVTSADAQAIQAHVGGVALITDPYKQIAADVNHSNTITTIDASLITQALMGNPLALSVFNISWRFINKSVALTTPPWSFLPAAEKITLNNVTTNQVNQDFYGIKIGDVNGTANPALFTAPEPLTWMVQDQLLQTGEEVSVAFRAAGFEDLASYQFALDFDPTLLQFVDIQTASALPLTTDDNFGLFNVANGEIRSVWSNGSGIDLGEAAKVFTVRFKVLNGGKKLSEVLQLNPEVLAGKAFNSNFAETGVQLVYTGTAGTSAAHEVTADVAQPQLLQNRPNPFVDETTIGFILPEPCEAQLRIYNAGGQVISDTKRPYTAGYHEIVFRDGALTQGLLYYELITPQGRIVKKMLSVAK